jgi:16S rRNA (cytosine967-C5)-methyltransferase
MHITSLDHIAHKIARAREDAAMLGYQEITYQEADATTFGAHGDDTYDVVFVDAPCSGLGTLRRHADKRMTLTPDVLDRLASLSLQILHNVARKVTKGGTLLYATCTISRRENDAVVAGFLATEEGARFKVDRIKDNELPVGVGDAITQEGYMQSLPQPGGGDGHFVARLTRA